MTRELLWVFTPERSRAVFASLLWCRVLCIVKCTSCIRWCVVVVLRSASEDPLALGESDPRTLQIVVSCAYVD